MRNFPPYEKKPSPTNYLTQMEYLLTHYRLHILLGCILILLFFLQFDNETAFPRFFPIFLLAVLIVMFIYSLYQTIKQKVIKNFGRNYQYIFDSIESIFSYFSSNNQKLMTDTFQARSRQPRYNLSFEAPGYPNNDFSRTLLDSRPSGTTNHFLNQENFNNENTIKSKEKKRNLSMEPPEIKKNPINYPENNQSHVIKKNIKGIFFSSSFFNDFLF